jgi:hypothetical protein
MLELIGACFLLATPAVQHLAKPHRHMWRFRWHLARHRAPLPHDDALPLLLAEGRG